MNRKVYIVGGRRSPIGKFLGSLSTVLPGDLGAQVVRQVLQDTKVDPAAIDEVIFANQHSAGQGPSLARRVQREAGIPDEIPATTVNMQCGSGMKAIIFGCNAIQAGADIILAGGVECMSEVPYILTNTVRKGVKMGPSSVKVEDSLYCDGLIDQFYGFLMGETAERVADLEHVTREEQDAFALRSQTLAAQAIDSGRFRDEIVPIHYFDRKKQEHVFDTDESITRGTTLESLQKLKPAFRKENGTVTAGNACQLNDGAAAVLLCSEDAVKKYGFTPIAEIVSTAVVGIDPAIMGLGPVKTVIKALDMVGMKMQDVELMELNEAFAAQSLGCIRQWARHYGITEQEIIDKTNVNGGGIALGHPVAATGTRVTVTLMNELKKRGLRYGVATMCVGGGMGAAAVIKMCD